MGDRKGERDEERKGERKEGMKGESDGGILEKVSSCIRR